MSETVGVIYPIPDHLKDRVFQGKTKVFVKYLARQSTRLAPNHKIIFYASRKLKKLIGEGIIRKVEFMTPTEVIMKYKDDLFVTEGELYAYARRSPSRELSKQMLTLVLEKLRRYRTPLQYHKRISMAGQYLSTQEYESLMINESE